MSGQANIPSVEDEPATIEISEPLPVNSDLQGETSAKCKYAQSKLKPGTPETYISSGLIPNTALYRNLVDFERPDDVQPLRIFGSESLKSTCILQTMLTPALVAAYRTTNVKGSIE